MKIETLEELLEEIFGRDDDDLQAPEGNICFCGSKKDAFDAAMKLMRQMVENDCPLWALQVASAMFLLSRAVSHGMGEAEKASDIVFAQMAQTAMEPANSKATMELIAMVADDAP